MAKIDVIVPAWNAERTIEPAIRSLLDQTEKDIRIIVVDDGSTDGTPSILSRLQEEDPRVETVRRKNGGVVAALQTGEAKIDAPFVARLDADDISLPDRFEQQLKHFAEHPELIAISGAHREIDGLGRETGRIFQPAPLEDVDPGAIPAQEPQIIHSFLMTRTEAHRRAGGYREVVLSEDTDLYWRLLDVGRVENLPRVLGFYRMHADSLSSKSVENGRILAVSSQFAAVSARRRRAGRKDLRFPFDRDGADSAAADLGEFVERASIDMDAEESSWMRIAVAAKIMELSGYRPFELQARDCEFIGSALDRSANLPTGSAVEVRKMQAATAARMLRLRRVSDATRVAHRSLLPQAVLRAATGRLYWRKHIA